MKEFFMLLIVVLYLIAVVSITGIFMLDMESAWPLVLLVALLFTPSIGGNKATNDEVE